MQELIAILNDWRQAWLCGLALGVLWIMIRLFRDTIDDFRR